MLIKLTSFSFIYHFITIFNHFLNFLLDKLHNKLFLIDRLQYSLVLNLSHHPVQYNVLLYLVGKNSQHIYWPNGTRVKGPHPLYSQQCPAVIQTIVYKIGKPVRYRYKVVKNSN